MNPHLYDCNMCSFHASQRYHGISYEIRKGDEKLKNFYSVLDFMPGGRRTSRLEFLGEDEPHLGRGEKKGG